MKMHISKGNMKMGRIPSFSLTPIRTCSPDACKTCAKDGCYALKSYRMYPSVRKAWNENTEMALHDLETLEAQLDSYFSALSAPRFFRVHVGGDFVTKEYAEMWARVARKASGTIFLAFTKQFDMIRGVDFPENFTIRLSDWPGIGLPSDLCAKYHIAFLDDGTRPAATFGDAIECPGNCETCGACWKVDADTRFHKH